MLSINAVCIDQFTAGKMNLPVHTPLLLLNITAYCIYHNQELPIEVSQSYYNSSIINYTVDKSIYL